MMTNLRSGCQRYLLLFIASAMVLLLAIAAAIKYVGWWAGVIVLVVTVIVVRWLVKRAVSRLVLNLTMAPFTAKSQVLKDARVDVHKIEKVSAPAKRGPGGFVDPDASRVRAETVYTQPGALPPGQDVIDPRGEAPKPPRIVHEPEVMGSVVTAGKTYWRIDLTLTPREDAAGQQWEPREIVLVPHASKTDFASIRKIEGIYPELVEVFEGGHWGDARGIIGAGRVRYTFPLSLSEQEKRWKLRYFFEGLGSLKFE